MNAAKEEMLVTDKSQYQVWEWRQGGLFTVLICKDIRTNKVRAMKIPKWEYAFEKELLAIFKEEATNWIKILTGKSTRFTACVVSASGIEIEQYTGLPVINLEQILGPNLTDYMASFGQVSNNASIFTGRMDLSDMDKTRLIIQIAEGLSVVIRDFPGYVHCDIKPNNILVKSCRWVSEELGGMAQLPHDDHLAVVGDIGLSRIKTLHKNRLLKEFRYESDYVKTIRNYTLSSVYTAPECKFSPEGFKTTSDVFSFGMIMAEMFMHSIIDRDKIEGNLQLLSEGLVEEKALLRKYKKDFDERIDAIIVRCLMRNPEKRYEDVDEVWRQLRKEFAGEIEIATNLNTRPELDLHALAESAARIGDNETAEALFEELIMLSKNNDEAHAMNIANLAALYLNMDRMKEAELLIDKAMRVCPDMFFVWHVKGHYHFRLENYQEAIESYKKCIALNPEWQASYGEMEECKRRMGRRGRGDG